MQVVLIAVRIVALIPRVSSPSGRGYWTLVPCLERASAEMASDAMQASDCELTQGRF